MGYISNLETYHNNITFSRLSTYKLSIIKHLLNNTNEHKYAESEDEFVSVVKSYLNQIENLSLKHDKKAITLKLYDYLVVNISILPVEIPKHRKFHETVYNKAITLEKENPEFRYYKYYLNDHLK
jgi:hypothetical protein